MTAAIDHAAVADILGTHLPIYRHRAPRYQTVMLNSLRVLWRSPSKRLLDVGGGTGVIGECLAHLFPIGTVTSVDVEDRFCPGLTIDTQIYDGDRLPFADGAFDAATINNVVHHIPVGVRLALFRDIARVVDGPLYIKDHLARGPLDHVRLLTLDAMGNIPFGGMVAARYLSSSDWQALADSSGWRIADVHQARYRHGPMAWAFPNRLETMMRWERV